MGRLPTRRSIIHVGAAGFLALGALAVSCICRAQGDDYPARPVRLIVPFPAGGGGDMVFRMLAQHLPAHLGQPIVVENRAGAAGDVGTRAGAQAAADGYTLTGLAQPVVINPFVFKARMVDPVKELLPVAAIASYAQVIIAHPSVPVRNLRELIAAAKDRPGTMSFASLGGTGQLALTQLSNTTGAIFLVVPYKGTADQIAAILSGQVMLTAVPVGVALPFIKDGRVRPIAYFGAARSALLPEVPTVSETFDGLSMSGWLGLAVPPGTPAAVVEKLERAVLATMKGQAAREYLRRTGNDEFLQGSAAFMRIIREDLRRYEKLVKDAGITAE